MLTLVRVFEPVPAGGEHTTNMVAVDAHGRACVLTHSLGVGAGVWLPGFDTQLNNLLGESDIAYGEPQPGDHLESRMAPTLVFDGNGLELAIGSAGATRLRTALATVLAAILDEGLDAETAVPCRASTPRSTSSTRSRVSTRRRSRRSRRADARFAAGSGSTTTSAASAASAGGRRRRPAPQRRRRPALRYFSSSLSMRREETYSPTSPIVSR